MCGDINQKPLHGRWPNYPLSDSPTQKKLNFSKMRENAQLCLIVMIHGCISFMSMSINHRNKSELFFPGHLKNNLFFRVWEIRSNCITRYFILNNFGTVFLSFYERLIPKLLFRFLKFMICLEEPTSNGSKTNAKFVY